MLVYGNSGHQRVKRLNALPSWQPSNSLRSLHQTITAKPRRKKQIESQATMNLVSLNALIHIRNHFLSKMQSHWAWTWLDVRKKNVTQHVSLKTLYKQAKTICHNTLLSLMKSEDAAIVLFIRSFVCCMITQTRSQAVARIADRTAKNCRGRVT